MQNTAANNKRREKDVMKLMMSDKFKVTLTDENSTKDFEVLFGGPKDSPYEGVSKYSIFDQIDLVGCMESKSWIARFVPI